jgi:hypothetical protein
MNPSTRRAVAVVVLALALAACGGGDDDTAGLPIDDAPGDTPGAAGACLVGEPDCQDTLTPLPGEEPIDLDPDTGGPIGSGGLSVGDVIATDIDGGFAIQAFYFADDSGTYLCDALAESFPPQCGAGRIPLDNSAGVDLGPLRSEQGVSWSDDFVTVVGEVVDGVFVATPAG